MILSDSWRDFSVIDAGHCGAGTSGEKLERWGRFVLRRPDPQAIWPRGDNALWYKPDAHYIRAETGGGQWDFHTALPESWRINWNNHKFIVRPTGFKHTGLFPEQAANWEWMLGQISKIEKPAKILNLFGYTGAATAVLAAAGAEVTHVDAAKGVVAWAKENLSINTQESNVRWIVDDCRKFIQREIRREKRYDAILLDPPSYGRGQNGELWKLEDDIAEFLALCAQLLSDEPLFVLLNSYTTGLQPAVLHNLLKTALPKGVITADELGLPVEERGLVLPCGAVGRWVA